MPAEDLVAWRSPGTCPHNPEAQDERAGTGDEIGLETERALDPPAAGALLTWLGVLVFGLLVVTTLQRRATGEQARAETQRDTSFRLADSTRQSSNDLTQMVRLYVSTGETRYLAIRS